MTERISSAFSSREAARFFFLGGQSIASLFGGKALGEFLEGQQKLLGNMTGAPLVYPLSHVGKEMNRGDQRKTSSSGFWNCRKHKLFRQNGLFSGWHYNAGFFALVLLSSERIISVFLCDVTVVLLLFPSGLMEIYCQQRTEPAMLIVMGRKILLGSLLPSSPLWLG